MARILWYRGSTPANLSLYPDADLIKANVTVPHDRGIRPINPPLSTRGRDIIDRDGRRIKLVSVNWYGASDVDMVPGGLSVQNRTEIARIICELGFNSVRLPYADELVHKNPLIDPKHLSANHDLIGLRALDVYAALVRTLTEAGLAVIVNNHITEARWCCDGNPCDMGWKNSDLGPFCPVRQTEEDWIQDLLSVMEPHIKDPLVVGVDLRNEVRGFAGRLMWDSWASAAERASERLHRLQPEWLMIVEGVQSANDLRGAKDRPVRLARQNKVVYSSHVYGWSGWGSLVPYWYRTYKSFAADMATNWGYLLQTDTAPVWVGEIGAPNSPSRRDYHYWKNLMKYLRESDADFAYWAINPRKPGSNSVETYGLLHDDWQTPVYDYRLLDMARLRQK
ncbi:endoglucanase E1 [Cladophialophora carrionii]|uniref:Endoglucanase E1 n=1 Tax=Cladophialophora carrionii TaxID=86049 RepID=A0A1C1CDI8_9EURO|nr:endoglucanase E1 [Cladophialophora carrionii]